MRRFAKLILALAIATPIITHAATSYYGLPKKTNMLTGVYGYVVVYDYSDFSYNMSAVTYSSGTYFDGIRLLPYRTPADIFTFDLGSDYRVCGTLVRDIDGAVSNFCADSGSDVTIRNPYDYTAAKNTNGVIPKSIITVTKH